MSVNLSCLGGAGAELRNGSFFFPLGVCAPWWEMEVFLIYLKGAAAAVGLS